MTDKPPAKGRDRANITEGSVLPTSQLKAPMPKVSPPKPPAKPTKKT